MEGAAAISTQIIKDAKSSQDGKVQNGNFCIFFRDVMAVDVIHELKSITGGFILDETPVKSGKKSLRIL